MYIDWKKCKDDKAIIIRLSQYDGELNDCILISDNKKLSGSLVEAVRRNHNYFLTKDFKVISRMDMRKIVAFLSTKKAQNEAKNTQKFNDEFNEKFKDYGLQSLYSLTWDQLIRMNNTLRLDDLEDIIEDVNYKLGIDDDYFEKKEDEMGYDYE